MKSESKIKTLKEYLGGLSEPRKSEIVALDKLIQKTLKLKPFMIYGMIGYGPFRYKYSTGREGDWCAVGLASQKNYISLYACMADGRKYVAEGYKKKLPKASIGRSCVRFKRLADVDSKVIVEMLKENDALYRRLFVNKKSSLKSSSK